MNDYMHAAETFVDVAALDRTLGGGGVRDQSLALGAGVALEVRAPAMAKVLYGVVRDEAGAPRGTPAVVRRRRAKRQSIDLPFGVRIDATASTGSWRGASDACRRDRTSA